MNKREYAEEVAKRLGFEVKEVEKNGIPLIGVSPIEGKIRPTIYIDKFFDHNQDIDVCVREVSKIFVSAKNPDLDFEKLTDFEWAKEHLHLRLLNKSNKSDFWYEVPGFDDLVAIPYLDIEKDDGIYSIKISSALADVWKVEEASIYMWAWENTKRQDYTIRSMFEVLSELMPGLPMDQVPSDEMMYVCTNDKKHYGAIGAVVLKHELERMFPDGYIVIPSSIHEVIIVPKKLADSGDLDDMVRSVNSAEVEPIEQLSDHVYIF